MVRQGEKEMKLRLEYIDGEVKTTNMETGKELDGRGLSPSLRDYHRAIRQTFEEQMCMLESEAEKSSRVPYGKLEIELELRGKENE